MRYGIRIGRFTRLVAACAALLPAVAGAQAPGVTPDSILIGESAPLSGSNRDLGNDIRDGANDVKRAGQNTRTLIADYYTLFGVSGYDAGGYLISFSPTNHNGSSFLELTMIDKKGGFAY